MFLRTKTWNIIAWSLLHLVDDWGKPLILQRNRSAWKPNATVGCIYLCIAWISSIIVQTSIPRRRMQARGTHQWSLSCHQWGARESGHWVATSFLRKLLPRGHQRGKWMKPRMKDVSHLINMCPTDPIQILNHKVNRAFPHSQPTEPQQTVWKIHLDAQYNMLYWTSTLLGLSTLKAWSHSPTST